jgi:hypothetical protein
MQCLPRLSVTPVLLALVFILAPVPTGAQNSGIQVSSPERIKEDFVRVP